MQSAAVAAQPAGSAMTAGATDTNFGGRAPSSIISNHPDFNMESTLLQHLANSVQQTQEAAELLRRQRHAIEHPHAPHAQQQPAASEGNVEQLLLRLAMQHPSQKQHHQQLHEQQLQGLLSQILTRNTPPPIGGGGGGGVVGVGGDLKPAILPAINTTVDHQAQQLLQQQQQVRPDKQPATPSTGSPMPCSRGLQHMASLADSSFQDITAADALLEMEFVARDAGSFTRSRGPFLGARPSAAALAGICTTPTAEAAAAAAAAAAAVPEATPEAEAAGEAGPAGGVKAAAAPEADAGDEALQAEAPHAAATEAHRSSSTGTAATTTPQPPEALQPTVAQVTNSDSGAAAAAAAAAAAPPAAAGAGPSFSAPQQQLLALLRRRLDAANQDPAGHQLLAAAAATAAQHPAAAAAALAAAPRGAMSAGAVFPPGDATARAAAGAVKLQVMLRKLREQLLLRQQQGAAAAGGAGGGRPGLVAGVLHGSLLQDPRPTVSVAVTTAAGGAAGGTPALSGGSVGGLPMLAGMLQRTASTVTNGTTPAAAAVRPAAAQVQAAAAGADRPVADDELLQLYADFQANRKQVLAIVQEALAQGALSSRAARRLQYHNHSQQQRAPDSPSMTIVTASVGAVPTMSAATQLTAPQPKRVRDQQESALAADAAGDADAPCSKLRRLDANDKSAASAAVSASANKRDTPAGAAPEAGRSDDVCMNAAATADVDTKRAAGQAGSAAAAGATAAGAIAAEPTTAAGRAEVLCVPDATAADGLNLLSRSVDVLIRVQGLSKHLFDKAASTRREASDALCKAEQFAALNAANTTSTQQLQLQNQVLQHQLKVAQLQMQAQHQQLQQAQLRAQQSSVALPQLVARTAQSVNRLVAIAYSDHMAVPDRQELARIAEDLLQACGQ